MGLCLCGDAVMLCDGALGTMLCDDALGKMQCDDTVAIAKYTALIYVMV